MAAIAPSKTLKEKKTGNLRKATGFRNFVVLISWSTR